MLNNLEQRESTSTFLYSKVLFNSRACQVAREFGFVLVLTVLGMIISLQGWKSVIPAFDMLPYFDNAYNLLHHGILPPYGDISSYGSFSPPGTSWLMALGMIVFKDPRLYEKAGSALIHLGTLWGIFLLTKKLFGTWSAYFSTLLYGFSSTGLDYAGSLWPIGHPFFYVWMVYFSLLWTQHKEAKYLAFAGTTWAIGMNVDMAIAPSLFILPAIWLLYRPPIFSRSLWIGLVVSLWIWYPYLKFDVGRDFIDLKSQIGRQNIFPVDYRTSWCDPHHVLSQPDNSSQRIAVAADRKPPQTITSNWLRSFYSVENRLAGGLLSNFDQATYVPRGNLILLLMSLSSLIFLAIGDSLQKIKKQIKESRTSQPIITRMYQGLKTIITSQNYIDGPRLLALSLAIPWLILTLVAEPGRTERFNWLWALQLLVISVFVTYVLPHWRVPKIITFLSQLLLLALILPLSSIPTRIENWSKYGWAGQDAGEKQVADYLASQIRAEGKNQASIGYLTFIYPFMADYNIINPRYKVGAEFDLLFKYQYGIVNTTRCAEGFSSQDEYRVVEMVPKEPTWAPRDHFNIPSDDRFKLIAQFGAYEVFQRQ